MNLSFARRLLPFVLLGLCAAVFTPEASGYALEKPSWSSGTVVTMQMELGPLNQTLQDGSPSWNVAVAPAIDAWNAQMGASNSPRRWTRPSQFPPATE